MFSNVPKLLLCILILASCISMMTSIYNGSGKDNLTGSHFLQTMAYLSNLSICSSACSVCVIVCITIFKTIQSGVDTDVEIVED